MSVQNYSPIYPPSIQQDNPSIFKKIKAGVQGNAIAGVAATTALLPTNFLVLKAITKINRSVDKDSIKILNKAGDTILKSSGLSDKGVSIFRNVPDDINFLISFFNSVFSKINLPKKLTKMLKTSIVPYQLKLGKNAMFLPEFNQIIATNKIPLAQFHELGHAMNYNFKGIGRYLYNTRLNNPKLAAFAIPVIALISILKNKKAKNEKTEGIFDRATTFIKNNAGKLASLTFSPLILEEVLATYKGENAVKNLISPELFKKVKISNRIGLVSYVTFATVAGLTVMAASKIRDKIAQPNLNK